MGFKNAVVSKIGAKAVLFISLLSATHLFMDAR